MRFLQCQVNSNGIATQRAAAAAMARLGKNNGGNGGSALQDTNATAILQEKNSVTDKFVSVATNGGSGSGMQVVLTSAKAPVAPAPNGTAGQSAGVALPAGDVVAGTVRYDIAAGTDANYAVNDASNIELVALRQTETVVVPLSDVIAGTARYDIAAGTDAKEPN